MNSYDSWKLASPYDYEPETPADYGWVHEDDLPDMDHCKDMLQGIIDAIYKTGDIAKLEDCLDELTHQFEMKIPESDPVLEKKGSVRQDRTLESWLQFNQGYNECLRNQATC